jgi:serine phosphatase RsbU (regulator of sigma subunit)
MELAAEVQDEFRSRTLELFGGDSDPSGALSELCLLLNRGIMTAAGRAHMTAAFLGVFNADAGTLTYINAGHVPALLLEGTRNEFLESTGLPLGLFSHATHEAGFRLIPPGGALLMASRGIVEARSESGVLDCIGRSQEFGADGLLKAAMAGKFVAQALCRNVLDSVLVHAGRNVGNGNENDLSVAAISRDL